MSVGVDESLRVAPDVLIVRTLEGWAVAPARQRDPVVLDVDALRALLHVSGGAAAGGALEPVVGALRDAGVLVSLDPDGTTAAHSHWAITGGSTAAPAVTPHETVGGVPFLARLEAGCLLAEGKAGERFALDEIDVCLLDTIGEPRLAADVFAATRQVTDLAMPSDDELGARLRRLVNAGRLQLVAFDLPSDATGSPASLAARLRRRPFPGRSRLASIYHRLADDRPSEPVVSDQHRQPEARDIGSGPGSDTVPEALPEGEPLPERVRYLDDPSLGGAPSGAIPVYAVWQKEIGPLLSLGMLTAYARAHDGGSLTEHYDIRRPEDPDSFFVELEATPGPGVLLLSNYLWSIDHNLDVARRAKAANPDLVIVHGGPSTPKYEDDCRRYFAEHGDIVDVCVRGEGEITLAELLAALAPTFPDVDLDALAGVPGLTYRTGSGDIVRNDDRERVSDLSILPSPYLTGEFDHIHPSAWEFVTLETNRGCPYGCTFCDWGSSTLSRIRKFDADRVAGEMEWAGERHFVSWALGDANFGIMSRDVETTDVIAGVKARHGFPKYLGFNVAKNTTKHLRAIVDRLVSAGVAPNFTLALQTRDEDTLEAVHRTNISTDHYLSLAASLRRRGLPIQADIMLGLPGQTVDSLAGDLQFLIDHEIPARIWVTQMLPNAPINDPEYRAEYGVEADEHGVVVASSTFSRDDRAEMMRIRHAYTVFEQFGLLRHVNRHVQWDQGVPAVHVLRRILALSHDDPERYPLLNWVVRYFDYYNVPPLGWRSFYAEVRRFLVAECGVELTPSLDAVLDVQSFLMPDGNREFPSTLVVPHDYVRYYLDRVAGLWAGEPAAASGPKLADYPPGSITVYGDPLYRCAGAGIRANRDPRNENMTENFWMAGHWELDSPLVINQPEVAAAGCFLGLREQVPADLPDEVPSESRVPESVRVRLSTGSSG